jgi:XTP/dITP diphosphohydrolase
MALPLPLVLATQNPDKAREIIEIFVTIADVPLVAYSFEGVAFLLDTPERVADSVATLPSLVEPPDVAETGSTLEQNARIKAVALARALEMPAVADDTGLEVDALDGAPGVYSARYAGSGATYADNVAKLLQALHDVPPSSRTARFATVAIARWPDGREIRRRGEVEGTITDTARGRDGFGYDPVFVPFEGDGRTFAEMAPDEKHAVSHRGRAFRALVAALTDEG